MDENSNGRLIQGNYEQNNEIECPVCAEKIKAKALKCRYCGHLLKIEHSQNKAQSETSNTNGNTKIKNTNWLSDVFSKRNKSEKIIIFAIFIILMSLILPWYHSSLADAYERLTNESAPMMMISIMYLIIILILITYPVIILILRKKLSFIICIICSLLLLYLTSKNLHFQYFESSILYIKPSYGSWLAFIGSVLFFIGAFLIRKNTNNNDLNNL